MSGYGVAADATGDLYFITGNSDSTFNVPDSIQESVVKMSPDLATISSYFTPWNQPGLDSSDNDYGSGGAMLLPDQSAPTPHLAAAAGKDGRMFLLNRDSLGGFNPPAGPDNVVGMGTSAGAGVDSPILSVRRGRAHRQQRRLNRQRVEGPDLPVGHAGQREYLAADRGDPSPGFFTSISSRGKDDAIIWALSRPSNSFPANLTLYAFKADSGASPSRRFSRPGGGLAGL